MSSGFPFQVEMCPGDLGSAGKMLEKSFFFYHPLGEFCKQ